MRLRSEGRSTGTRRTHTPQRPRRRRRETCTRGARPHRTQRSHSTVEPVQLPPWREMHLLRVDQDADRQVLPRRTATTSSARRIDLVRACVDSSAACPRRSRDATSCRCRRYRHDDSRWRHPRRSGYSRCGDFFVGALRVTTTTTTDAILVHLVPLFLRLSHRRSHSPSSSATTTTTGTRSIVLSSNQQPALPPSNSRHPRLLLRSHVPVRRLRDARPVLAQAARAGGV